MDTDDDTQTTPRTLQAADIYERIDNPDMAGSIDDDLVGLTLDEMGDYFGDLDPIAFL